MTDQNNKQDIIRLTESGAPLPRLTLSGLPRFEAGWVWIAGAGPGDPGLLTLHTANALQQADVIIHDALVSEDILAMADNADILYAGKRGGKPSWTQADISARLVDLARDKKRVLRLKGGDPFVFGRGGEEAEALRAHKIPFRILPGVTAGVAAPAYAGIPVTHRAVNHAVTFVTGHMADDAGELLDWTAIAQGAPVIVIYMAMSRLARIAERLIEAGRAPDTPVGIITHATTPQQRVLITTLEKASADVETAQLTPPSIIIVGAVVPLGDMLGWFDIT